MNLDNLPPHISTSNSPTSSPNKAVRAKGKSSAGDAKTQQAGNQSIKVGAQLRSQKFLADIKAVPQKDTTASLQKTTSKLIHSDLGVPLSETTDHAVSSQVANETNKVAQPVIKQANETVTLTDAGSKKLNAIREKLSDADKKSFDEAVSQSRSTGQAVSRHFGTKPYDHHLIFYSSANKPGVVKISVWGGAMGAEVKAPAFIARGAFGVVQRCFKDLPQIKEGKVLKTPTNVKGAVEQLLNEGKIVSRLHQLWGIDHPGEKAPGIMKAPHVISQMNSNEVGAKNPGLLLSFSSGTVEELAFTGQLTDDLDVLKEAITKLYQGLAFMHSLGIPHKDIKPSNIMMGPDGFHFVDYGEVGEDFSKRDWAAGTYGFMSQEDFYKMGEAQVGFSVATKEAEKNQYREQGLQLANQMDIFALGMSLYAILMVDPEKDNPKLGCTASPYAFGMQRMTENGFTQSGEDGFRQIGQKFGRDLEMFLRRSTHHDPSQRPTAQEGLEFFSKVTLGPGSNEELTLPAGEKVVGGPESPKLEKSKEQPLSQAPVARGRYRQSTTPSQIPGEQPKVEEQPPPQPPVSRGRYRQSTTPSQIPGEQPKAESPKKEPEKVEEQPPPQPPAGRGRYRQSNTPFQMPGEKT